MRFPDTLTRMHAVAKASTAGVALALVGTAIIASTANEVMSLLFATLLQTATNPVSSTLLTLVVLPVLYTVLGQRAAGPPAPLESPASEPAGLGTSEDD